MDKPEIEVGTTASRQGSVSVDTAEKMAQRLDHIYANESVVQISKNEVRLSFFDLMGGNPKPRAGVVLPLLAAVEFHLKLSRAMEIIKKGGVLDIDKALEEATRRVEDAKAEAEAKGKADEE